MLGEKGGHTMQGISLIIEAEANLIRTSFYIYYMNSYTQIQREGERSTCVIRVRVQHEISKIRTLMNDPGWASLPALHESSRLHSAICSHSGRSRLYRCMHICIYCVREDSLYCIRLLIMYTQHTYIKTNKIVHDTVAACSQILSCSI